MATTSGTSDGPDRSGWRLVPWPLAVLAFYLASAWFVADIFETEANEARERHAARLDPSGIELGRTPPDTAPPPGWQGEAAEVVAGIYVDRIVDVSPKSNEWTADFYIWFRWPLEVEELEPGQDFQIVNGEILANERHARLGEADGYPVNYELRRVVGRITKFFNLSRFPSDDHLLTLEIEDRTRPLHRLRFRADEEGTALSSRVRVPGYRFRDPGPRAIVRPHAYKTRRGSEGQEGPSGKVTFSQLVYGVEIARGDRTFFFKLFQGVFGSVAIALVSCCVRPTLTSRMGISVGAFFASVAASYVVDAQLPTAGIVTMADYITGMGSLTAFLTLVHSAWMARVFEANPRHAVLLDRAALAVFSVGFITFVSVVARAAAG